MSVFAVGSNSRKHRRIADIINFTDLRPQRCQRPQALWTILHVLNISSFFGRVVHPRSPNEAKARIKKAVLHGSVPVYSVAPQN
jgi:hypothetical protein